MFYIIISITLPIAPKHCGNPKAKNPLRHSSIFCLVRGMSFKYKFCSTGQAKSQKSITIWHTVDVPTPNKFPMLRYSADDPKAYKAMATRLSMGIALRHVESFFSRPPSNFNNFLKLARVMRKLLLKKSSSCATQSISQKELVRIYIEYFHMYIFHLLLNYIVLP